MTLAVLGWRLPPILTGLVEAAGGDVRVAPYARPGTDEMADRAAAALADRGACFMRHHGLLAVGADLERAFRAASVTEARRAGLPRRARPGRRRAGARARRRRGDRALLAGAVAA